MNTRLRKWEHKQVSCFMSAKDMSQILPRYTIQNPGPNSCSARTWMEISDGRTDGLGRDGTGRILKDADDRMHNIMRSDQRITHAPGNRKKASFVFLNFRRCDESCSKVWILSKGMRVASHQPASPAATKTEAAGWTLADNGES